jgi:hypothetical protein
MRQVRTKVVSLLAGAQLTQLVVATDCAYGQSTAAPTASYCSDLKRVVALALSHEKFASIAGKAREGNFLETTLPLPGWRDCSLYGAGTYTCDSPALTNASAAEQAQAETLREIAGCFGDTWTEAHDRSSANYVVLHSRAAPLSITLSTDQTEKNEHIVRLILFIRRNQVGQ